MSLFSQTGHHPTIPSSPSAERHAGSSLMECEEFILLDWSPPNDPARPSDDDDDDDDDDDAYNLEKIFFPTQLHTSRFVLS